MKQHIKSYPFPLKVEGRWIRAEYEWKNEHGQRQSDCIIVCAHVRACICWKFNPKTHIWSFPTPGGQQQPWTLLEKFLLILAMLLPSQKIGWIIKVRGIWLSPSEVNIEVFVKILCNEITPNVILNSVTYSSASYMEPRQ